MRSVVTPAADSRPAELAYHTGAVLLYVDHWASRIIELEIVSTPPCFVRTQNMSRVDRESIARARTGWARLGQARAGVARLRYTIDRNQSYSPDQTI